MVKGAKKVPATNVVVASCILLILAGDYAFCQSPQEKAWEILQTGLSDHGTGNRAAAVSALGLLQDYPQAIGLAEKALSDKKPAVRAAAATALGEMGARRSIPLLKEAMRDKQRRVAFAAANSLITLGDSAGYDWFYEVLTGERKSGEGLIEEKKRLISDRNEVTLLVLGVAAGFAPYAGYGWMMWSELSHDYVTPVRVNAAKKLADHRDPRIGEGLIRAASDKHWKLRLAALRSIAHHDDPDLITGVTMHLADKKAHVRYTAAAAVLRLSALEPATSVSAKSEFSCLCGCPPGSRSRKKQAE